MFRKLELPFLKEFKDAELEAFIDDSWGSLVPGYRERIRAALQQRLKTQWNEDVLIPEIQAAGQVNAPPRFKKIFVSISHSKMFGGFVIGRRPVGFDIENPERVEEKIVQRISVPDELKLAPSPAHLWTAKEATYKALLHYQQPKVIAEVLIGGWNQNTFALLNDKLFKAPVGVGSTWEKDGAIFALFTF